MISAEKGKRITIFFETEEDSAAFKEQMQPVLKDNPISGVAVLHGEIVPSLDFYIEGK